MKARWGKPVTLITKLVITVALLWWLSRKLDLGIVLQKLLLISPAALLLSLVLLFCGNLLAIVRWNIFVKMIGIRYPHVHDPPLRPSWLLLQPSITIITWR